MEKLTTDNSTFENLRRDCYAHVGDIAMKDERHFLSGAATCARRGFLMAGAAFAAGGRVAGGGLPPPGAKRLTIGVLSDIHVTTAQSTATFRAALRYFDSRKVDGVLVCGDLADHGLAPQLQHVADAWFSVFKGNRRSDGEPVVNLIHFGDHDMGGYMVKHLRDYAARKAAYDAQELSGNDTGAIWKRCFGEEWAPIQVKTVKGYTFVLAHHQRDTPENANGNTVVGAVEALAKLNLDPAKPFFFSQHRIFRNTAGGPGTWGQDSGVVGTALARYPNCIAFCGHGHLFANDGRNLWQGAYTAIEVPSLRYLLYHAGRENGFSLHDFSSTIDGRAARVPVPPNTQMDHRALHDAHQGYVMEVYDDRILLERRDFAHAGEEVAPPWVIPLVNGRGDGSMSFAARAARTRAPEFSALARISARTLDGTDAAGRPTRQIEVAFPPALSTPTTPRAIDYEVTAYVIKEDVARIVAQKRVYSWNASLAESRETAPVTCLFAMSEIPQIRDRLKFTVAPMNEWGKRGAVRELLTKL